MCMKDILAVLVVNAHSNIICFREGLTRLKDVWRKKHPGVVPFGMFCWGGNHLETVQI